jgi:hypothetical protein
VRLSRNIRGSHIIDVMNGHPEADDSEFTVVANRMYSQWRWGVEWQLVVKDSDDRYWETIYREQTNPEYYISLTDAELVRFDEVEPYEEVIVKFRAKK